MSSGSRDRAAKVPAPLGGQKLDAVVRSLFETTWGAARRLIETGKIQVDGEVITDPGAPIEGGADVLLSMNAPRPRAELLPRDAIVHVDAHVVVVNKPSGISTIAYIGDGPSTAPPRRGSPKADAPEADVAPSLEERVVTALRRKGEPRRDLGVVHRIDKETSGLVVFTRSWLGKQSLSGQFRAHTIERRYLAIAHGEVRSQTFRSHLIENRGDGLRGSLEARNLRGHGQLAVTHVEALERLKGASLLACRLETGRTHRIRIHLSESGHPIVGEKVYVRGFAGPLIAAPRLMLHAKTLGFVHPKTEAPVSFECDPPSDFQAVLRRLRV